MQTASSPEDFGAHLYPHFTKSCVCTFLQGFCDRNHDVAEPAFFSQDMGEMDMPLDDNHSHVGSDIHSGSGGVDAGGIAEDKMLPEGQEEDDKPGWSLPFFGKTPTKDTKDADAEGGVSLNSVNCEP